MDGNGHPVGVGGEDLHEWARICKVADVFEALTSERPYRRDRFGGAGCWHDPPITACPYPQVIKVAGAEQGRMTGVHARFPPQAGIRPGVYAGFARRPASPPPPSRRRRRREGGGGGKG